MEYLIALLFGICGIFGHWYTRYIQNKTRLTFSQYMHDSFPSTLAAVFATIGSTSAIAASGVLSAQGIFLCYTAGYTMDSMFNKDSTAPTYANGPTVNK